MEVYHTRVRVYTLFPFWSCAPVPLDERVHSDRAKRHKLLFLSPWWQVVSITIFYLQRSWKQRMGRSRSAGRVIERGTLFERLIRGYRCGSSHVPPSCFFFIKDSFFFFFFFFSIILFVILTIVCIGVSPNPLFRVGNPRHSWDKVNYQRHFLRAGDWRLYIHTCNVDYYLIYVNYE